MKTLKLFVVCGYNSDLILAKVGIIKAESREQAVDKTDGGKAWDYPTLIVMTVVEAQRIGAVAAKGKRS